MYKNRIFVKSFSVSFVSNNRNIFCKSVTIKNIKKCFGTKVI
jgi:hypothetical protein